MVNRSKIIVSVSAALSMCGCLPLPIPRRIHKLTVECVVVDAESKKPVPDAAVCVDDPETQQLVQNRTNERGEVKIETEGSWTALTWLPLAPVDPLHRNRAFGLQAAAKDYCRLDEQRFASGPNGIVWGYNSILKDCIIELPRCSGIAESITNCVPQAPVADYQSC